MNRCKSSIIVNQLSGMQFAEAAIKWNGIVSKSTVIMDPLPPAALNCRNFDVKPGVDVETDKSEPDGFINITRASSK